HYDSRHHLDLHSFPTRRSSDLESLDTMTLAPRCRALISSDFAQLQVWVCGQCTAARLNWNPLHILNPLVEVCLLTMLAREGGLRSEEHTSELQSQSNLVCRLLL